MAGYFEFEYSFAEEQSERFIGMSLTKDGEKRKNIPICTVFEFW